MSSMCIHDLCPLSVHPLVGVGSLLYFRACHWVLTQPAGTIVLLP